VNPGEESRESFFEQVQGKLHPVTVRYYYGPRIEKARTSLPYLVRVLQAHVVMLAEARIIPGSAAVAILTTLAAIATQALKGHFLFELGRYFGWYVLPSTVSVVLFAILAIFMQTLVPQKAVGWMLMLLFVVAQITLDRLGFEHNLYKYGVTPPYVYSDMNGFGHFLLRVRAFQAYWAVPAGETTAINGKWGLSTGLEMRRRLRGQSAMRGRAGWRAATLRHRATSWRAPKWWRRLRQNLKPPKVS